MTYLAFLALFLLPPIALLALALRGRVGAIHPRAPLFLAVLPLIALAYTTPWDNYLVRRGVWSYGEGRVVGTIGWVPVEEYLFFLLQPVLTGLWLYTLLAAGAERPRRRSAAAAAVRRVGAGLYLLAAGAGGLLLGPERGTYLGLILAWSAPVLAGQWYWAGAAIWARRRLWLAAIALPTLYLWVADAVAIRLGIWSIAERFTTGAALFGLPLEEAVFFLVTNVLVVQGLMLFLFPRGSATCTTTTSSSSAPATTG